MYLILYFSFINNNSNRRDTDNVMFYRLASVQEQRLPDARLSPTNEDTPPITPTSSAKVLHRWHCFYINDKCRIYFTIFWLGWNKKIMTLLYYRSVEEGPLVIIIYYYMVSIFVFSTRKFHRTCGVLQKHIKLGFFFIIIIQ